MDNDSERSRANLYWNQIAPGEHLVQIYRDDGAFLDCLEGFVAAGLEAGDGVIVIATAAHRAELEERLANRGLSLNIARSRDQYIPLDAGKTLSEFMLNGWPHEKLFERLLTPLLKRARGHDRRVRAFGEMVALTWGQGLNGATFQLEHLWHTFCKRKSFSLLCAYPRSGFTRSEDTLMQDICSAHSRVIAG